MDEHYIVEVDFGDNAVTSPKHIQSDVALAAYLAKLPNMIGFQMNQVAQINIIHVTPQRGATTSERQ